MPLARLFATKFPVVGFDINKSRVDSLRTGRDTTLEVEDSILNSVLVDTPAMQSGLFCTTVINDMSDCNYFIITVPTPVDKNNRPDLTPLYKSSETVGTILKKEIS